MPRLHDKICVITGAARGIGRAIADRFHAEGAHVILTDINHAAGIASAAQIGCRFEPLDVRIEADWTRLGQIVPRADVVVNNAGITGFEDGTFLGCRYAISAMKAQGHGAIINISSRSGMVGIPQAAAYASSKAAIRNHSKTVALYCAQQGWKIRCNSIHPAAILTPMWEPMLGTGSDRDATMDALVADTPLRRFGRPEEVAAVALMLAEDESAYVTGTEITLDGGLLAGSAASPG